MYKQTSDKRGFTIVELLIVIVVIGILAAVTIVAYNGVQNRAKASAAQTSASQAVKKVLSYAAINNDLFPEAASGNPANIDMLSSIGVTNGSTTYQYSADNTTTPRTFCITATNQNVSYYQNNTTQTKPTVGACPGHGGAGVVAVTNQYKNPFFIGAYTVYSHAGMANSQIVDVGGTRYAQMETTSTAPSAIRLSVYADRWAVNAGQKVYARATIRNANATDRGFSMALRFYDSAGSTVGNLIQSSPSPLSGSIVIAPGATYTFSWNTDAPAGAASVTSTPIRNSGSGAAVGDLIQVTGIWLGDVDAAPASGDTSGWVWNGTPYAATSTGPQQ